MKNKINYKSKGYRLSKKIIINLGKLKKEEDISYNLLFEKLINNYEKRKKRIS